MEKIKQVLVFTIIIYLLVLAFGISYSNSTESQINTDIGDNNNVTLKFYMASDCENCKIKKETVIYPILEIYSDNISYLSVNYQDYKSEFYGYGFSQTPGLVIFNSTNLTAIDITKMSFEYVNNTIAAYLSGKDITQIEDNSEFIVDSAFGVIDISEFSIPVLTVVLGALDSINPCSFFILLVLLSLLINAKSQKKMIIIGGIFIFFSGLIYFILMVFLLKAIEFADQPLIISVIAGVVAIVLGFLNIKDFFYFKRGISASISKQGKKKLFKQMRDIIKIEYLPAMIAGTIILAITANTYELACTLGLPFVYIKFLELFEITGFQSYFYIFLYNLIYVIPLILIVSIFVITLGKRKLTEFQGRSLKLVSGLMMFSFGEVFLINPALLRNIFSVIIILFASIGFSLAISSIWKPYEEKTNIS
jgi:hypothetical protein